MKFFKHLVNKSVPFILLILLLIITIELTLNQMKTNEKTRKERLAVETYNVKELVSNRVSAYVDTLYGLRGLFSASESVERNEWATYVKSINLSNRHPGVFSVSYAEKVLNANKNIFIELVRKDTTATSSGYPEFTIFPESNTEEHYVIKYIEPFETRKKAFGLDYGADPIRKKAAEESRDTGNPSMTGIFKSVNTGEITTALILPIYQKNMSLQTVEERRLALAGFTIMAFQMNDFFNDIFMHNESLKLFDLEVYDQSITVPLNNRNLFFDQNKSIFQNTDEAYFHDLTEINIGGRKWTIKVSIKKTDTLTPLEQRSPYIILFGGIIVSFSLFEILYLFSKTHEDAVKLAQKMTEGMRENENKFKIISSATKDAIIIIDDHDNIIFWNSAATTMFGYSTEEIIGKKLHAIIPYHINMNAYSSNISNFSKTGNSPVLNKPLQLEVRNKKGKTFPIELMISSIQINNVWHAVGIARNITERKKIEEEKTQHTTELERINKIMVDRELKMIELKEKLSKLKKE